LLSRSAPRLRAALAAAVAGLVVAACDAASGETTTGAVPPPPPEVTVAAPVVDTVEVYEEVVGRFTAVNAIEIRAQVSGRLAEVLFEDGQQIQAGDPLFVIERAPFEAAVAAAEAELARVEAQATQARQELSRAETLTARGTMSQEQHDLRARAAHEANAAVHAAEARLQSARIDLGYADIAAPIDGRISDRRIDVGNLVGAGESLLTTLVSENPIHVEFAVTPEIAGAIARPQGSAPGAPVSVRLEGETEYAHAGRLDFIDNQVDPRSGVVRLRARLDNDDGLFTPGQFARVRFSRARIEDAVLVPDTAVSSDQNLKYVLLVNAEDIVEPRPIAIGPVVDGLRVVYDGLAGGERVIVAGGQRAYPGMQVTATPGRINVASR
jgi:RND family efflux transporter MFP subunit